MAFPPKEAKSKEPKPELSVMIGTDDEEAPAPSPEPDMPGSAKAAAAKALFSAFKEQNFEAAASALEAFMDALDDAAMDDTAESADPEASPF